MAPSPLPASGNSQSLTGSVLLVCQLLMSSGPQPNLLIASLPPPLSSELSESCPKCKLDRNQCLKTLPRFPTNVGSDPFR